MIIFDVGSGTTMNGTFIIDNSANVVAPPLVIQISDCNIFLYKIFIKTQKITFSILFLNKISPNKKYFF